MSNKQQTAVEWIFDKLLNLSFEYSRGYMSPRCFIEEKENILNQAKAMEKEQMKLCLIGGFILDSDELIENKTTINEEFEQYYTENYGE